MGLIDCALSLGTAAGSGTIMNWIILQPGSAQTEIRMMSSVPCFEIAHVCCSNSIFSHLMHTFEFFIVDILD
jgi:hypothetical protein